MPSITVDSVLADAKSGRVYVRYDEGGMTFEREFASVAVMREWAATDPVSSESLLKTLVGSQVKTDEDVTRIEKAVISVDMDRAQPLIVDTSRVKPREEVVRG
jgi:hypothetical protein